MSNKVPRRQLILEALASELESSPGSRITTAILARSAGVSEAALYRHFASKAQMLEALIGFAEETIFSRANQIMDEYKCSRTRCSSLIFLVLGFSERNPGITRVLLGDALVGENERLHTRVDKFFDRLQTQFRQILREAAMRGDGVGVLAAEPVVDIVLGFIEGRMHRFLRTRFRVSPLDGWQEQWRVIEEALFELGA